MVNIVITSKAGSVLHVYRGCDWEVRGTIGYVSRSGKEVRGFALNNLDAHNADEIPEGVGAPVRDEETGEVVSGWTYDPETGEFSEV